MIKKGILLSALLISVATFTTEPSLAQASAESTQDHANADATASGADPQESSGNDAGTDGNTEANPIDPSSEPAGDANSDDGKAQLMARVASGEVSRNLASDADRPGITSKTWEEIMVVLQSSYGLPDPRTSKDVHLCVVTNRVDAMKALARLSNYRLEPIDKFTSSTCSQNSPFVISFNRFMEDYKAAIAPTVSAQKAEVAKSIEDREVRREESENREEATQRNNVAILVGIAFILCLAIRGIVLGVQTKVIFYSSGKDVFKTCLLVVLGIVLVMLPIVGIRGVHADWPGYISLALIPVSIWVVYKHSKSVDPAMTIFDGFCVSLGKIILLLLAFAQIGRGNNPRASAMQNRNEKLLAFAILAAIGYLVSKLINRNRYFAIKLLSQHGIPASKANVSDLEDWLENHLDGGVGHDNYEQVYELFSSEIAAHAHQAEEAAN